MSVAQPVSVTKNPKTLTQAQVEAFNRNGYHFPVRVITEGEAVA